MDQFLAGDNRRLEGRVDRLEAALTWVLDELSALGAVEPHEVGVDVVRGGTDADGGQRG